MGLDAVASLSEVTESAGAQQFSYPSRVCGELFLDEVMCENE